MPKGPKSGTVSKGAESSTEKPARESKDMIKLSDTKESIREKAALAAAVKVLFCHVGQIDLLM